MIEYNLSDINESRILIYLIEQIKTVLSENKTCNICVSGGSTPKNTLIELSKENINWNKVYFFQTDERIVSHTSKHSNFKNILSYFKGNEINIFPMYNGLHTQKSVINYQNYLDNNFLKNKNYSFDILILGFGTDGHIASIFPQYDLCSFETKNLFITKKKKNGFKRISMKMNILKISKKTIIISYGQEKFKVLKNQKLNLPVHQFISNNSEVAWFYKI